MMIIFGGRSASQAALNDAWGLRRHRNGSWDWIRAPYKAESAIPMSRYQHSVVFVNAKMVVTGGKSNQPQEIMPLDVYDTESSEWKRYAAVKRFRHACWYSESFIYIHGGFLCENPNFPTDGIIRCSANYLYMNPKDIIDTSESKMVDCPPNDKAALENKSRNDYECGYGVSIYMKPGDSRPSNATYKSAQEEKKVLKLSNHAHVAMSSNIHNPNEEFGDLIRQISLEKLQEESRKLAGKSKIPISAAAPNSRDMLHSHFLNYLLKPSTFSKTLPPDTFAFKPEYVIELARECRGVLQKQSVVGHIKTPVKVFGNIHGDFMDLMRFFDIWKAPNEDALGGDIESFGYVFLGNYVDRGARCLETVCLLFALKCKYPEQIYLLRGNHEDRAINAIYGFGEECKSRLQEDIDDASSVFQTVNDTFSWLPIAAIIEEKVLCIHAGIGPNLTKVESLLKIQRPIGLHLDRLVPEAGILFDALWSDPASNLEAGYKRNPLRSIDNIVSYGADKINQFLFNNKLELIIRGHEIALDGFSVFNDNKLITVTSCADYCGRHKNSACMLVIPKTFEVIPKLIPPTESKEQVWNDDEVLKRMPPTPPRQRISGACCVLRCLLKYSLLPNCCLFLL
eukprot:TRINITY_DN1359_c0_g2_i1.p1 TRINITY_DN1359_c0_g2~~TRINITY_DN1359_c0_g2_i1.p1  ORF type:complete len:624 (+),score=117.54 TRINITY_DN1359_c0_g2_i1:759-2630(+)